jgi:hypothetical protein
MLNVFDFNAVSDPQVLVYGELRQPNLRVVLASSPFPGSTETYLEIIGRGRIEQFTDMRSLSKIIQKKKERLERNEAASQYIGIKGISGATLTGIEKNLNSGNEALRFNYESSEELLIIKVPGGHHEITLRLISSEIDFNLRAMGAGNEYVWGGASKYSGASNGPSRNRSKEGDEAFLPRGRTYPNGELPITLTRPNRSVIQQQKTPVSTFGLTFYRAPLERFDRQGGRDPPVYSICLYTNDGTDFCRVV